jgi:hypothetical protein
MYHNRKGAHWQTMRSVYGGKTAQGDEVIPLAHTAHTQLFLALCLRLWYPFRV